MAKVPSSRLPEQRRARRDIARYATALALLVLATACGEQPVSIDDPDPNPTPMAEGVALEGEPSAPAVEAVRELGPTPAPSSEIDDGFFRTRLRAVIAPSAWATGSGKPCCTPATVTYMPQVMNSPWARLMIPIIPKMIANPAAASTKNDTC